MEKEKLELTKKNIISSIILSIIVLIILLLSSINLNGNGFIDYSPSIYLLSDKFHSGILIPNHNNLFKSVYSLKYIKYKYVFHTFADKSWFLEGNINVGNVFPTLFLNTTGVIEKVFITTESLDIEESIKYLHLYDDIDIWSFPVKINGLKNAIKYIEEEKIKSVNSYKQYSRKGLDYYFLPTYDKYKLFYNCHHFSIEILSISGIETKNRWYNFIDLILRIIIQIEVKSTN